MSNFLGSMAGTIVGMVLFFAGWMAADWFFDERETNLEDPEEWRSHG
jgi:hypothetical protein